MAAFQRILVGAVVILFFSNTQLYAQSDIDVNPTQFTININEDEIVNDSLLIQNNGTSDLTFTITVNSTQGGYLKKAVPAGIEEIYTRNAQTAAKSTDDYKKWLQSKYHLPDTQRREKPIYNTSELAANLINSDNDVVKVAVVQGIGTTEYDVISVWDELNYSWMYYGETPVIIDYSTLDKDNITYLDLVYSNADVLVVSQNCFDYSLTQTECMAIIRYINEGHGLFISGTAIDNSVPDSSFVNQAQYFAPLIGINPDLTYETIFFNEQDTLDILDKELSIWQNMSDHITYLYTFPTCPYPDHNWYNALTDGEIIAVSSSADDAIIKKANRVYHAGLPEFPDYFNMDIEEGYQLLYNIFAYGCSGSGIAWLTLFPRTSGTTEPAAVDTIGLIFNATDLPGGTYEADLVINSNDPVDSVLTIPITMNVTGQPDIAVFVDTLNFRQVYINYTDTMDVYIWNQGSVALNISNISSDQADYSASSSSLQLAAGDSQHFEVRFSPSTSGLINGNLTLESNDPDEPVITIALIGEGQTAPDIGVSPLSFDKELPYGAVSLNELTINNLGESNLNWSIASGYDSTSSKNFTYSGAMTTHNFTTGVLNEDAILTVTINGDFDGSSEYAEVIIEGTNLGQIEDNNVATGTDIVATFNLSGTDLNNWTTDGILTIQVDNSSSVNTGYGSDLHKVRLQASGIANWITLSKNSGIIPGNQSDTLGITLNTNTVNAGTYSDNIVIKSNDPDEAEVTVSVSLTVTGPSISVNPSQISLDLYEGEQADSSFTISNGGPGLLNFDILLSSQTQSLSKKNNVNNEKMTVVDAVQQIIQRSGILEKELKTVVTEPMTGEQVEMICSKPGHIANTIYNKNSNSGYNVAILGADHTYDLNDVQAKLVSANVFKSVSLINVANTTPNLAQLQAFDAVFVFNSYNYYDRTTLGNVLADYVDQGGGVVCALFEVSYSSSYSSLAGKWQTNQYYVIERSYYTDGQKNLGTIHEPDHPIMNGVTSFDGGYRSYRPSTTSLTSNSTLIASWSDGKPLVAIKRIGDVNRVDLGFYPVSGDRDSYYWQTNTDGALLMANSLIFAAGGTLPWCEVDPLKGSILSGNSQKIQVSLDAGKVDQGTHQGYAVIENNDPGNSNLTVSLSITVTDTTHPGKITDLSATNIAATFATFSWTAPGDNNLLGIAESYDIRYSTQQIDESTWQTATIVTDSVPKPAKPGITQKIKITNLNPNQTYYIAIKTKDEAELQSTLSNIVEIQTTETVDCIIYLPLDEGSGSTAFNYQGDEKFNGSLIGFDNLNGCDIVTNSGWTQYGFKGNAVKMDGSSDYIKVFDYSNSPLKINSGLSIKMAIKPRNDVIPSGQQDYTYLVNKKTNYNGYDLRLNHDNGRLRFMIQFGSNNAGVYESNQQNWIGGQWYNIMITYDYASSQDNVKIYINDELDASYTESRILTTNDEPIYIGGSGYNKFAGTIDEFIIHNKPIVTSVVKRTNDQIPTDFSLSQNYPNPFPQSRHGAIANNPITTIDYSLPKNVDVILTVFNIKGQRVATLVNKNQQAGFYTVFWDGSDNNGNALPSGIYFYKIKAGNFTKTVKMSFVK